MKHLSKRKPLVSVIMPVYNAGDYLVEAIDSIVRQTYQNLELIIVDDASTDNSWKIIRRFKKRYPRKIKTIRLQKNLNRGGDACANLAFQKARGEYIARMDADDISDPQRIEKQVRYMETNKDVIVLGTQAFVINKEGKITGEKLEPVSNDQIRENYFIYHPMIHPSVMIRKSLLPNKPNKENLYRIRYSANNDLLTFFELMQYGRFANLSEKLIYYRIHEKNDSLVNPKEKFFNTLKIRIFAWQHLDYDPTLKAVLTNILQLLVISFMPSRAITFLYMLWRGVAKPADYLTKLKLVFNYSYSQ